MRRLFAFALSVLMLTAIFAGCSKTEKKYVILDENFGDEYYAVAFRKGDDELTIRVQEILDEMATDGTSAGIATKWFGSDVVVKDQGYPREITDTDDGSLQYILDKGSLIVGFDDAYPPMTYLDDKGKNTGFDIDMATAVAERLGVELKLQPISWDAKDAELENKNIDCIWSGLSVNDERIDAYNLTKPYLANAQIILVPEGSGITSIAGLAGKKVGTQAGSAALDAINEQADVKATFKECVEFPDYNTAFLDLKAGRIDALVGDKTFVEYILAQQD